jgi:hypothetical protein
MRKKIPVTLLLAVVIAIGGVFATTGVMAQTRPLECTSTDEKITLTPTTNPLYDFPHPDDGTICGKPGQFWLYTASSHNPKFLAKINKIYFYIPSDPLNPIDVYGAEDPGAGGTSGWAKGIYNGVIYTAEEHSGGNPGVKEFGFCTSSDVPGFGLISAVFDTGTGGELGCVAYGSPTIIGGIIGPGFDISEIVLAADYEDVNLPGDGCVRVKRHKWTGCIQNFKRCNGEDILPEPTRPSWLSEDIADFGDPTNRRCRGGIIATSGSPTVYWGWIPPNYYYCLGVYDPNFYPYWWTIPCPGYPD